MLGSRLPTIFVAPVLALLACAGCASSSGGLASGVIELEPTRPADHATDHPAPKPKLPPTDIAHSTGIIDDSALSQMTAPPTHDPVLPTDDADRPGSGFPPVTASDAATNATAKKHKHDAAPDENADLAALAKQLQGLSGLDPSERQALLDDLKQSDPTLWPQLIRQFRTALAYRNRPAAKAAVAEAPASELNTLDDETAAEKPQAAGRQKIELAPEAALAGRVELATANAPVEKAAAPVEKIAALAAKPPLKSAPEPVASADQRQFQLTKAILALEGDSSTGAADSTETGRQIELRLLYLASGRRDDALKPIPGLSAAQQEFWTKELYGLSTYLDSERVADPERRATEAAHHLRDAACRIGELANPVVSNLAFCKEVSSFGVYKKFPKYEFKAGEEVLLYSEIENLKAESTDRGFHTNVKSSYQILDSRGQKIAEQEFPASDDFCTSPHRDFFIPYFIWFPKSINDGSYVLQLTVEDMQTKKIGQSSIQFAVK